ncbi:hypothetical protein F4778DRAFT_786918 [Xylariomycetidae sp. FL2044]|nr:hypothetical protein F4778DRAFT_786918 [Xylariomycetidae sp. FL2044]
MLPTTHNLQQQLEQEEDSPLPLAPGESKDSMVSLLQSSLIRHGAAPMPLTRSEGYTSLIPWERDMTNPVFRARFRRLAHEKFRKIWANRRLAQQQQQIAAEMESLPVEQDTIATRVATRRRGTRPPAGLPREKRGEPSLSSSPSLHRAREQRPGVNITTSGGPSDAGPPTNDNHTAQEHVTHTATVATSNNNELVPMTGHKAPSQSDHEKHPPASGIEELDSNHGEEE